MSPRDPARITNDGRLRLRTPAPEWLSPEALADVLKGRVFSPARGAVGSRALKLKLRYFRIDLHAQPVAQALQRHVGGVNQVFEPQPEQVRVLLELAPEHDHLAP